MELALRFDQRAIADLAEIRRYIALHDPAAAERVRLHIRNRIQLLKRFPDVSRPTDFAGVRVLAPTRYPYRIYFARFPDAIVILHIRHTSRKAPGPNDL
ncbi:MAG: type II toxin-antitoxin system RelE/ParE family toxin [Hyphomicrobiaceae bacterium]